MRIGAMNVRLETRDSSSFREIIPLPNFVDCIVRIPISLEKRLELRDWFHFYILHLKRSFYGRMEN